MKEIQLLNKDDVAWVTLSRPDVRNAFNEEMIAEMTQAFKSLADDISLRAVVINGEGESFCAGGDLNWMKSMINFSEKENLADSERLFDMYQALSDIPVPVVCKVHGHVFGGGLGLVAASDICFADTDTQFCFSEVRLGLAPAVISAFVAKKIQPQAMSRYFMSAEVFDANMAKEMGLVSQVENNMNLQEAVEKWVNKVIKNGPIAVRSTKKLIRGLSENDDWRSMTTELIAKLRVGDEGQEGLAAFFAKRKPSWIEARS